MLELYILLIFMIAGAIIAVEIGDLLSAIVAVGAVGLALSVAFLILKAPDLAITQLVVEILCLIILIRATITRDTLEPNGRQAIVVAVAALAFMALFIFFAFAPLNEMPPFGAPTMRVSSTYLANGLRQTGAANIVSSIILDYRGYDTLGEATILFTAVIGVLAVMRRAGKKRQDTQEGEEP
jgi:multisubunit Na+/H+ antiporter MnhB subunit